MQLSPAQLVRSDFCCHQLTAHRPYTSKTCEIRGSRRSFKTTSTTDLQDNESCVVLTACLHYLIGCNNFEPANSINAAT